VAHRFVAAISEPGRRGSQRPARAAWLGGIWDRPAIPVSGVQLRCCGCPHPLGFRCICPAPKRVLIVTRAARCRRGEIGNTTWSDDGGPTPTCRFVPGWNRRQLRRIIRDVMGLPGRTSWLGSQFSRPRCAPVVGIADGWRRHPRFPPIDRDATRPHPHRRPGADRPSRRSAVDADLRSSTLVIDLERPLTGFAWRAATLALFRVDDETAKAWVYHVARMECLNGHITTASTTSRAL